MQHILHLAPALAYAGLFLLVAGESAGLPLPGETALVTAAVLSARGTLSLPLVVGLAAAGAIAGDNLGYLVGRRGLRWALTRSSGRRARMLKRGERFFERHGTKAVFFGRFVPVGRMTVAWLAGAHQMRWRRFAAANALGGVVWATAVGVAAFTLGAAAARDIRVFALGLAGLAVLGAIALILTRKLRREPRPPASLRRHRLT